MPKAFLELVADELLAKHPHNLSKLLIVLPSRRAGLFLRRKLASKLKKPVLGPQITVIDALASEISGLNTVDSLSLQFQLYQSYSTVFGDKRDSFDEFLKWSNRLLQDFNEIDRYLIDAKKLYDNLTDVKRIESWGVDGEMPEAMDLFLQFWKQLHPVYKTFTEDLRNSGSGYQGLIYRRAAEELEEKGWESYLNQKNAEHLYFLGFNALNNAEISIIRRALDSNVGDIYFDADELYMNDEEYEAGMFLRRYKDWPYFAKKDFNFVQDGLKSSAKKIELVGVPRTIGMAKAASEKLAEMKAEIGDSDVTDRMALVLADEGMLLPALNSIPPEFDEVNVTMGLPINRLSLSTSIEQIFDAHERALRLKTSENRSFQIYHKDIERMLLQPFGQFLLGMDSARKAKELSRQIRVYNAPFLGLKKLEEWLPESPLFLSVLEEKTPIEVLQHVAEILAIYHDSDGITPEDRESSKLLYQVCHRLIELFEQFDVELNLATTLQLFRQLQREETLDFFGEPLRGLQVMGILETRLLSFERLIITHVNEDVLPAGRSENSFIPYDLKHHFGLPTHKEKDAIYAYHFYRLMQGVKHVCLLYDTEGNGMGVGEASRFIEQIRREWSAYPANTIEESIWSTPVHKDQVAQEFSLEKGTFILEAFKSRAERGVAPSHLQQWVRDPSVYYKRYVLGAEEPDEVEEVMGDRTIGNVVHKVLENFYDPFVKKAPPGDADYDALLDNLQSVLASTYKAEVGHKMETEGRSGLVVYAILEMLKGFLKEEKKRARGYRENGVQWQILGVEEKLKAQIALDDLDYPIQMKGLVDRLDKVGDRYVVIDYKTGSTKSDDVRVTSMEQVSSSDKKLKALQLFAYAWLLKQNYPDADHIEAGIFSLRSNKEGLYQAAHQGNIHIGEDDIQTFEGEMTSMLQEMFSLNGVIQPRDLLIEENE